MEWVDVKIKRMYSESRDPGHVASAQALSTYYLHFQSISSCSGSSLIIIHLLKQFMLSKVSFCANLDISCKNNCFYLFKYNIKMNWNLFPFPEMSPICIEAWFHQRSTDVSHECLRSAGITILKKSSQKLTVSRIMWISSIFVPL